MNLTWTSPTRATDGVSLAGKHGAGPLSAEICREDAPGLLCSVVGKLPVASGTEGAFHENLPGPLAQGPLRAVRYRVVVRNAAGHAGEPADVTVAGGEAPAPMEALRAAPAAGGILVTWKPESAWSGDVMLEVRRGGEAAPKVERLAVAPQDLGAGARRTDAKDSGGALDTGGHAGTVETYLAYRTRQFTADRKLLRIDGASATAVVAADAKAPPPGPPEGLDAVVNTMGPRPEVDLVWRPAPASDAGDTYRVYRAEGDGALLPLGQPVHGLTFADTAVRTGSRYRYAVTAVDKAGQEGRRSAEITVDAPAP